jgi:Putative transposase
VLSRVFRGKFVAGLRTAFREGKLQFHGHLIPLAQPRTFASWLRLLFSQDWVVYAKRPFGGPGHALRYLGYYTHRVALSNHRLVALTNNDVIFRWRDSAHGNKKRLMTLPVDEFLRRLPAPSTPTRLRPYPQLRLPCQPATCSPVAALLALASRATKHPSCPPQPFHLATLTHPGSVPCAAPPCMSLNNSQQLTCCSVPRHRAQTAHEPTPSPSIPTRAHTRIHLLCLTSLKPRSRPSGSRFSAARNSLTGSNLPAKSTYATL